MNYRHLFHAGNFADVFKHIILITLIHAFHRKEKGCVLIDTHSGLGLYDLESEIAQRNPEYLHGIVPILKIPAAEIPFEAVKDYLNLVKEMQPTESLRYYPGSPIIMRNLLRQQDKLILNELHPEDYQILKKQFSDKRIHIHQRDCYEFLPAILPPKPQRGLIFIDPPYEQKDEFTKLIKLLTKTTKLFPQGVFVIWYPVVHDIHKKFLSDICAMKSEKDIINTELILTKNFNKNRRCLRGSGIVVINAPYEIEKTLIPISGWLESLFVKNQNDICPKSC